MTPLDPRLSDLDRGNRGLPAESWCVCGHSEEAHSHFRAGDDCGACGCVRYWDGSVSWVRFAAGAVLLGVVLAGAYRVGCGW